MKCETRVTLSLLCAAFFTISGHVAYCGTPTTNPATVKYTSASGGQALVSGTSTLHDWTVKSTVIQGTAEFSGEWKPAANPRVALQSVDLAIPVNSLKSTEGGGMDNTMYDAMKLKQFPTISYKLIKASLKAAPAKEGSPYQFDTTGELSIAGSMHTVNLDLSVLPPDGGQLTIAASVGLKMSDYGITPPTAMLGMIKSGDAVTVKVNWQLSEPASTATAKK